MDEIDGILLGSAPHPLSLFSRRLVLLLLGVQVMPPPPLICYFVLLLGVKQDYGKDDLSVEVSLKGHEWGGDISLYKILDKRK